MSLNELPYYEYRGWYLGQGITMPVQGIYEVNVYSSKEKLYAEQPDHAAINIGEAREWVDQQVVLGG